MVPDRYDEQAGQPDQYAKAGLDRAGIVAAALAALGNDAVKLKSRAADTP